MFPVLLGPTKRGLIIFQCPACGISHQVNQTITAWNKDPNRPTFQGELVFGSCVSTITDGLITFLAGPLRGQTRTLQENF